MALVPFRLATAMVTAGCAPDVFEWKVTYEVGSASPSTTSATSRTNTGRPRRGGHDDVAQVIGCAQAAPRLEAGHLAARDGARRGATHVGAGDRLLNRERIEIVGRQPRGVDVHANLPGPPADEGHLRHVVDFSDGLAQLGGERSQLIVLVTRRPHRHGQDRHVVDRARLDDGPDDAGRDAIRIRRQLLIEANERCFLGSPTLKRTTTIDCPGLEVE